MLCMYVYIYIYTCIHICTYVRTLHKCVGERERGRVSGGARPVIEMVFPEGSLSKAKHDEHMRTLA